MRYLPLIILTLTPLMGSCWGMFRSPHSQFEVSGKRDPLAMNIHMVHLREFDLKEGKAVGEFRFENRSGLPLTIQKIKPSCGCVSIRHRKEMDYQSEEKGRFYVEVDTAGEASGLREYRVEIETINPAGQTFLQSVQFRVDVPERKVTVVPRALIAYQLSGQPTTQTITLTDYRQGNPFEVAHVSATSSDIKFSEPKISQDEHGHQVIQFEITIPGELPADRITDTVVIQTTDEEFNTISVPLLAYGPKASKSQISKQTDTAAGTEQGSTIQ
ncbi:MAG: DUF1573 domain-containing protein [Planctomycetaceae bacterium]|nr:DUF1573 domain-containing protein [Planctomycetaceae bacterium]